MTNKEYTKSRLEMFCNLPHGWEHDDSLPGNRHHQYLLNLIIDRVENFIFNAMIDNDGRLGLFYYKNIYVDIEISENENSYTLFYRSFDRSDTGDYYDYLSLDDIINKLEELGLTSLSS